MKFSEKSYVLILSLLILSTTTPAEAGLWDYVGVAVVGAVGGIVLAPVAVTVVGFGSAGIAAGTAAASMMSASAIASGGGVAAGGVVATLQAVGATGSLTGVGAAVAGTVGAVVGAAGKASRG